MPKQMLEISTSKTVDNALGDYLGRTRNKQEWTKEDYDWQNNKGTQGRQYGVRDWSRASLNFEVVRGEDGQPVVQPIDHAKPSLEERWQRRIDEGYKATVKTKKGEVKKPIKKSEIKIVKMELGGDRERMHELAFDRKVNLGKRGIGTNGDVQRKDDIEQWAVDCFNHLAKKFGAANIIDFIVHLDETNPHIHATLVPLTRDGKLSYTELFGGSHAQAVKAAQEQGTKPNFQKQMSDYTKQLHTDFAHEVGEKWGLERGDDIKITGNVHKSTAESLREHNRLEEEIDNLEKQNSSLQTSIVEVKDDLRSASKTRKKVQKHLNYLTAKSEALSQQIGALEQQLEKGAIDLKTYQDKKEILQKEYDKLGKWLSSRRESSVAAEKRLDQLLLTEVQTEDRIKELQKKSHLLSWEIMKQGDKVDEILKKKLEATKELLGKGWPGIDKAIEILISPWLDDNFMNESQQTDVAKALRKDPKERMEDVKDILAYVSEIREGITVDTKAEVVRLAARDVAENYKDISNSFSAQIYKIAWDLRKGIEFVTESANAIAVCLMVGYNEGVSWVASKCGGGGGQDTGGWRGKDKDEDDRKFFGRCLSAALGIIKPQRVMPQKEVPQKKGGFSL